MNSNSIDSKQEANNVLRQYYNKVVPFTVAEDAKIVNAENVTATFIIPESCFPFTGYDVVEFENNYNWHSQISVTIDHIFLRLWRLRITIILTLGMNLIWYSVQMIPIVKSNNSLKLWHTQDNNFQGFF
jgi:hypothetical protein